VCNLNAVRNWLLACLVAIFAAIATILGASIASGSYWYTYLAPVGMVVAAGFTGSAVVACGMASSALDTYCMCAATRCSGPCGNLRTTLNAASVVLGAQAVACLTVAAYSWIPDAAPAAQWVIIGALVIEAALLIAATSFFNDLEKCQQPAAPRTSPAMGPRLGGAGRRTNDGPRHQAPSNNAPSPN
jgi:hypothetical protein